VSRIRVGMESHMMDIYEIARFVGMPGDKVEPFIAVLEMCGYRIRGPQGSAPSADHGDAGTVTAQADPHQNAAPQEGQSLEASSKEGRADPAVAAP
jgi:hypothetical protein